jgi:large repetitive protein
MFKQKLAANVIILTLLLGLMLQVTVFGISMSRKNSGIVYASTGIPISGASVSASGSEGYGGAITDTSGNFLITSGLPNGSYTITVYKTGYIDGKVQNITVTAGIETSGVSIYLNKSGGISGKITSNATGNGLANIFVAAEPFSGGGTYGGFATTDASGNYEMNTNLPTGTYNVTVFLPTDYVGNTRSSVSVTAGSKTTGIDLSLLRSGIMSGHITTPLGAALANVTVFVTSTGPGGTYYGSGETNATGAYRIESGLGTGNYTVTIYSGLNYNFTSAMVTAGSETSNVDLQLSITPPTPPPPSGTITGRVTDASNKPIDGASMSASGDTTFSYGYASTDSSGNYVISEGLETDTYTVTASATGYVDQNQTGISVTVNQTRSNVNFQLQQIPPAQSGRISGTVMGDANPIPEFQYPIMAMLFVTLVAVAVAKLHKPKTKYP